MWELQVRLFILLSTLLESLAISLRNHLIGFKNSSFYWIITQAVGRRQSRLCLLCLPSSLPCTNLTSHVPTWSWLALLQHRTSIFPKPIVGQLQTSFSLTSQLLLYTLTSHAAFVQQQLLLLKGQSDDLSYFWRQTSSLSYISYFTRQNLHFIQYSL